ncbi:hypothetical protein [Streptomyces olivaceoviridis]|uniref:hypothetical protein n=1 Tax=Streptomyces olivaceoviridis TaxID=1921 RepID=UPI00370254D2
MALPVLLIAEITLAASFAPLAIHLSPLLVAARAFTAAFARTPVTVATALIASAAAVLVDWHDGLLRSALLPLHIGALPAVSGCAVVARALHDRDLREPTQVPAVSEAAPRVVLRPLPRTLGSLYIASMYRAATAHALVGGDLYAAARTGRTTRILGGTFCPVLERAATWTWKCPQHLLRHLSQDLDSHVGPRLDDDLALVAVHPVPRRPS